MFIRVLLLRFQSFRKGFTLVELLVSITIMTMVLGISVSGAPLAIMRITLADNAYKTELLLREVQLQGSAINSVGNIFGGAGVFFNLATSSDVLKFKDRVDPVISARRAIGIGDGLYNRTPIDERESVQKFINQHHLAKLCVASGASPLVCNTATNLTISYIRPKQTAHIYINNSTSTDFDVACIQVDSPLAKSPGKGYVRSIFVYKSGMITKKVGTCN